MNQDFGNMSLSKPLSPNSYALALLIQAAQHQRRRLGDGRVPKGAAEMSGPRQTMRKAPSAMGT